MGRRTESKMLKVVDDEGSSYTMVSRICCSVNTFLAMNYLWGLLSLVVLAIGLIGLLLKGNVLIVLPPEAYLGFLIIGGFSLFAIFVGICGQKMRVELLFLCYIFLMALGLIGQTLGFSYLILYSQDVAAFAVPKESTVNGEVTLEKNLLAFALEESDKWEIVQDRLGCCGIDFEISGDVNAEELLLIESGNKCEIAAGDIEQLRDGANFEDANQVDDFGNFELAIDNTVFGLRTGYFCMSKISLSMEDGLIIVGVAVGVLLLVQISALVAASRMYWVPEYLGGWQFDEEELEVIAERKGLKFNKEDENNGRGILSTIRNQTNRLSFRIQNAYTADPEAPRNQGFFQRLSLRNPNEGNFAPTPPGAPQRPMGAPNTMFNRISQRLFNVGGPSQMAVRAPQDPGMGGRATFAPAQPSGPPPGMGGSMRRMSQKISQGFSSIGSAFGRKPLPPNPPTKPEPPAFGMPDANNNRATAPSFGMPQSRPPTSSNTSFQSAPPSRPPMNSFQGTGPANPPSASYGRNPSNPNMNYNSGRNPSNPNMNYNSGRVGSNPNMGYNSSNPSLTGSGRNIGNMNMGGSGRNIGNMNMGGSGRGLGPSGPPPPNMRGGMGMPSNPPSMGRPTVSSGSNFGGPPSSRPSGPNFGAPTTSAPQRSNPPPANPPKPRATKGGKKNKKKSKAPAGRPNPFGAAAAGGGGGGGLLAQIRGGTSLKPTVTIDKSAPKF